MARDINTIDAMVTVASFLFNLEADKGYDWIYGGRKLGEIVDIFCRMTGVERPIWETIIWPKDVGKPNKDAS